MTSTEAIAYTYEADVHCASCTYDRFGALTELTEDREGNPIGVIMSWDEWYDCSYGQRDHLACGDCHAVLAVAGPTDGTVEEDGASDGRNAASWVEIDSPESAAEILCRIEDCDFDVPSPLSGEWAGDAGPGDIAERFGVWADDDDFDTIIDQWDEAYRSAYVEEVERMARSVLKDCVHFDRFDIAEAYCQFVRDYTDPRDHYTLDKGAQLARMGFRARPNLNCSTLTPNALGVYLNIVDRHSAEVGK